MTKDQMLKRICTDTCSLSAHVSCVIMDGWDYNGELALKLAEAIVENVKRYNKIERMLHELRDQD